MKIKLRRGWICLKMNLTKFMKLLMKKIVQLPVYNPFFKKLKNLLKILCWKKNWKGSMFLIKLKPQFWHLKAPFVIIRQDLVMVWSHILEKTWVHTSVKFVVMNREMVKFWRNTWFNIHIKYVMSWKTNAMSVIFGPQWTYY